SGLAGDPYRRTSVDVRSRSVCRAPEGRSLPVRTGGVRPESSPHGRRRDRDAGRRREVSKWVASIEKFIDVPAPLPDRKRNEANTFVWPGFEAVYGAAWPSRPFATCLLDAGELNRRILDADRHQAIYSAVALYEEAVRKYLREEEARPQLWFAIVPD